MEPSGCSANPSPSRESGSPGTQAGVSGPIDAAALGLGPALARAELEWLTLAELVKTVLAEPRDRARRAAAELVADSRSLAELARFTPEALRRAGSVTPSQARRLAAAFELGRRVERAGRPARPLLRAPAAVAEIVAPLVRGLERETFLVLLLDGKHRLRRVERVSEGTLTSSLVHPREVFRPAIAEGAAAVVVAHNHPSGDPEPSAEDLEVTRRLLEVGRLVGIPVLDHLVVGEGRWVSLRERMKF